MPVLHDRGLRLTAWQLDDLHRNVDPLGIKVDHSERTVYEE